MIDFLKELTILHFWRIGLMGKPERDLRKEQITTRSKMSEFKKRATEVKREDD